MNPVSPEMPFGDFGNRPADLTADSAALSSAALPEDFAIATETNRPSVATLRFKTTRPFLPFAATG